MTACQTTLKQAGEAHQTAGEKWYALGQYASSTLTSYGVTVTAKLNVDNDDPNGVGFVIGDIGLSESEDNFSVDLLRPNFEHKYICTPVCTQLVEYLNDAKKNSDTLLTKYFDKHEFELFEFYGDIYVLDDQLALLAQINATLVDDYLHLLIKSNNQFDTLKEFSAFLREKINKNAYQHFVKNPYVEYAKFTNNYFITPDQHWASDAQLDLSLQNPNLDWANVFSSPEIDIWTIPDHQKDRGHNSWLVAKAAYFGPGDTVCSYQENYFGIVDSISTGQVELTVIGQSKMLIDGAIMDAKEGELFHESANGNFLPVNIRKTFSLTDVARCTLQ